jgi:hypothetical protein
MKTTVMYVIASMALIAGLAVAPAARASDAADVTKDATKALAGSTALELPAKAASLVAKAVAADKKNAKNVTSAVVQAAVGVNPSAAAAIVSAVAHENPAMAPVAAVTAVTLQHKRLEFITKAAAAAAPSEAARIVAGLIKEFPQDYGIIALAAAEGAPLAGREILSVVADYIPALQPAIQNAMAKLAATDGNFPVQAILSLSYDQAKASGMAVKLQIPSTVLSQDDNQSQSSGAQGLATQLSLGDNNPSEIVGPAASARALATGAQNPSQTAGTPPSLSPPTLGPPYQPVPGNVINIGPGQITPQAPGGHNYSAP